MFALSGITKEIIEIDETERDAAISRWNDIIENGVPTKTAHTCRGCGAILAVCTTHTSYQDFKRCQETLKPLCAECASWPGSPLPSEGTRGQEVSR